MLIYICVSYYVYVCVFVGSVITLPAVRTTCLSELPILNSTVLLSSFRNSTLK